MEGVSGGNGEIQGGSVEIIRDNQVEIWKRTWKKSIITWRIMRSNMTDNREVTMGLIHIYCGNGKGKLPQPLDLHYVLLEAA